MRQTYSNGGNAMTNADSSGTWHEKQLLFCRRCTLQTDPISLVMAISLPVKEASVCKAG